MGGLIPGLSPADDIMVSPKASECRRRRSTNRGSFDPATVGAKLGGRERPLITLLIVHMVFGSIPTMNAVTAECRSAAIGTCVIIHTVAVITFLVGVFVPIEVTIRLCSQAVSFNAKGALIARLRR